VQPFKRHLDVESPGNINFCVNGDVLRPEILMITMLNLCFMSAIRQRKRLNKDGGKIDFVFVFVILYSM